MNILCIDGGGMRGVFALQILKKLEEEARQPLRNLFDMIGGTSTGAIVAAAAAIGKSMGEVLGLYEEHGKEIFTKRSQLGLFKSWYDNERLKKYLQMYLGHVSLSEVDIPLVIPSVDMGECDIRLFRSYERADEDIRLWDAVLSSCSAPLYFQPNNVNNDYLAADGGLYANNPSLVCLTEAMQTFGCTIESVRILSVGTGKSKMSFSVNRHQDAWGLWQWLRFKRSPFLISPKVMDLALILTSESISQQCRVLCGERYLRINRKLPYDTPIDDITSLERLQKWADDEYIAQRKEMLRFTGISF
jgi:uncharacterized protein